ncbi:type III-B CRISPR module RAMP protein Cmr6 [Paenibacillus sp. J5C2022]|uniref:type III-B CRISPR module RAMP protein Cmr6 n=1 Tax=Paenibacillus sp. J5C2022 TaxID=2977129 RepID=UPI0021D1AE5C|nr:type III-B CRISPR module RAMP protein Cmr6 [Paenibacillus sp. J5C2022]
MNAYYLLSKYRDIESKMGSKQYKTDVMTYAIDKHKEGYEDDMGDAMKLYRQRFQDLLYRPFAGHAANEDFSIIAQSNLLIGTSATTVLETGLALHRLYGVPYIPGTALKGLTANYCHSRLGREDNRFQQGGDYFNILFGSQGQQGFICFYDAFPHPCCVKNALKLDFITPHHKTYYQVSDEHGRTVPAPRDDDSPEPIPFIAAKGAFRVMLTCERQDEAGTYWLQIAKDILMQALAQEGIGSKTNSGYGRFEIMTLQGDQLW